MAKADYRAAIAVRLRKYPEPVTQRSGAKVGWLYYKTKVEANTASKLAVLKAAEMAERGYDFGYMSPGSVRHRRSGEYAGLWEVVIP